MTTGGKPVGVHIVEDADLWENGGVYVVLPQAAVRVTGMDPAITGVTGGVAMPIYIVNGTPLESRGVEGGQPLPVAEMTTRPVAGHYALPVYVMNSADWPGGGPPVTSYFELTTTSESGSWGPNLVKTGDIPIWEAYDEDDVLFDTQVANQPTFDFSSLPGVKRIRGILTDGAAGATELLSNGVATTFSIQSLFALTDLFFGNEVPDMTTVDLSGNTQLIRLNLSQSMLTALDLSLLTQLEYLALNDGIMTTIDLSNNINLVTLEMNRIDLVTLDLTGLSVLQEVSAPITPLSVLDISGNPQLSNIDISDSFFTPSALDDILINLDNAGLSNGVFVYSGQDGGISPTLAAQTAYDNLIGKGWTLNGNAPA